MSQYAKAIVAFFTTLGTWGATASADGRLDPVEWWGLCGVIVATIGVFQVTNAPAEDDGGQAAIWYVLLGAAAAVILLALANRIDL